MASSCPRVLGCIVGMCLGLSMASGANAQREPSIERGTIEIQVSGALAHSRFDFKDEYQGSSTEADLRLGVAGAFSPVMMVGGTVIWDYLSFDPKDGGSGSASRAGLQLDLIANLPRSGSLLPYFQLSAGVIGLSNAAPDDLENSMVLPLLGVGLRTLVGDHASLNVLAGFQHRTKPAGVDDTSAYDYFVRFGFSVFPGGLR